MKRLSGRLEETPITPNNLNMVEVLSNVFLAPFSLRVSGSARDEETTVGTVVNFFLLVKDMCRL